MSKITNSSRSTQLPQSPIRKLIPFAQEAKIKGIEVLHLNIGQPDILTPQVALDAVKNYHSPIIKYGLSKGKVRLCDAIAKHYQAHVAEIESADVYVTSGASEAIQFVLFAALDPGDEMIIPQPFYANYIGYSQMAGIHIVPLHTDIDSGFQLPSVDKFEVLITKKTKAIFLCNPNNPTGQLYTQSDLESLAILVKEHNLYLIVDEVYRPFVYEQQFYSALSLQGLEQHVVVIDSISKVFSACGARVGCIVTRNQNLLSVIDKFGQLRLSPPDYGQELAIACYGEYDEYIKAVTEAYRSRRDIAYNRLSRMQGVTTYMPPAAFYNMIELDVEDAEDFCIWLLSKFHINNETLMLAPANGFYADPTLGKKQVRLAFVLNEEKLERAFDILEYGIAAYKNR